MVLALNNIQWFISVRVPFVGQIAFLFMFDKDCAKRQKPLRNNNRKI